MRSSSPARDMSTEAERRGSVSKTIVRSWRDTCREGRGEGESERDRENRPGG